MKPDDVLARIDEILDALFPRDETLDERTIDRILRDEIEADDEDPFEADDPSDDEDPYDEDDDDRYGEDDDDPFGLYELQTLHAEWIRRRGHAGAHVVHGVSGDDVVFVAKPVAYGIDAALPRVDDAGYEWETAVPWVDSAQEQIVPEKVVERYGTFADTALDGPVVTFRADDARAIVRALERHGMYCERDDELVARVRGTSS